MKNKYLDDYASFFGYKKIFPDEIKCAQRSSVYLKKVNEDFMVMEKIEGDKYVNFYLNNQRKIFKESDLFLAVLCDCPVAWEQEK